MVKERMLAKAIEIASSAHCGQEDLGGQPYIFHSLRVMLRGFTWNERIVGVLHDVLEDTSTTLEDLQDAGFDDEILDAVVALTRDEEKETYPEFIDRVIRAGMLAIVVKLNDMEDNMAKERTKNLSQEHQDRLHAKYHDEYIKLMDALGKALLMAAREAQNGK